MDQIYLWSNETILEVINPHWRDADGGSLYFLVSCYLFFSFFNMWLPQVKGTDRAATSWFINEGSYTPILKIQHLMMASGPLGKKLFHREYFPVNLNTGGDKRRQHVCTSTCIFCLRNQSSLHTRENGKAVNSLKTLFSFQIK